MTPEVLLSSEDLLVIGPPSEITVDLDLGAKGERGSRIFSYDDPDPIIGMSEIAQTAIPYDIYVNLKRGDDYLTAYQYISIPGVGYSWEKIFNFYPRQYRKNFPLVFNDGVATKTIVVTEILPLNEVAGIEAENFSINYNIENPNPIATSIDSISLEPGLDDFLNLTIVINALEYEDGSWTPLSSGEEGRIIHLDIRVV